MFVFIQILYCQMQESNPGQGGSRDYSLRTLFATISRISFGKCLTSRHLELSVRQMASEITKMLSGHHPPCNGSGPPCPSSQGLPPMGGRTDRGKIGKKLLFSLLVTLALSSQFSVRERIPPLCFDFYPKHKA